MPTKTIPILGISCVVLFAAYLALFAATIFFATVTTQKSALVRELESYVAVLETNYYSSIADLSAMDLTGSGYVTPASVEYVAKDAAPAVTRAPLQY